MLRRALLTVLGLFLAGCCLFAPLGCSAGAIVAHANAARTVAPVISAARTVIHDARRAELAGCLTADPPESRVPCFDAGTLRWAPALVSYNVVVELWNAWMDALELASLAGMSDVEAAAYILPTLTLLVDGWRALETLLEPFEEVDLPDFPGLSILGGR